MCSTTATRALLTWPTSITDGSHVQIVQIANRTRSSIDVFDDPRPLVEVNGRPRFLLSFFSFFSVRHAHVAETQAR
jgi:hypothetical protein